jgi:hypothetical protein
VRRCEGPVRRCEGPVRRCEGPVRKCEGPVREHEVRAFGVFLFLPIRGRLDSVELRVLTAFGHEIFV